MGVPAKKEDMNPSKDHYINPVIDHGTICIYSPDEAHDHIVRAKKAIKDKAQDGSLVFRLKERLSGKGIKVHASKSNWELGGIHYFSKLNHAVIQYPLLTLGAGDLTLEAKVFIGYFDHPKPQVWSHISMPQESSYGHLPIFDIQKFYGKAEGICRSINSIVLENYKDIIKSELHGRHEDGTLKRTGTLIIETFGSDDRRLDDALVAVFESRRFTSALRQDESHFLAFKDYLGMVFQDEVKSLADCRRAAQNTDIKIVYLEAGYGKDLLRSLGSISEEKNRSEILVITPARDPSATEKMGQAWVNSIGHTLT